MGQIGSFFKGIADWPFLQEPLYRWVLFFIALTLIGVVWRMVQEYMKA